MNFDQTMKAYYKERDELGIGKQEGEMNQIESWVDDEDWEDERDPDWDDDEWECEFGERCLMPSFIHRRDECYTVEMAQAWEE